MHRVTGLCVAVALVVPQAASAQFGSIFRDAVRGAKKPAAGDKPATTTTTTTTATSTAADAGCTQAAKASRGSNILGSVLGGAARRTVGRSGIGYYVPVPEFSDTLTAAFACKLEPTEQKKAAEATKTATRGETVGASSSWTSEARENVSGSSTVTGKERLADGTRCMTVRDSAFVNGEETTISKRMCRAPGATGYTLAA